MIMLIGELVRLKHLENELPGLDSLIEYRIIGHRIRRISLR